MHESKIDLQAIKAKYIGPSDIFPTQPVCSRADPFNCCCRQQFGLETGPGFIGGASASISSMGILHLYQKYKTITKYISSKNKLPPRRDKIRYELLNSL